MDGKIKKLDKEQETQLRATFLKQTGDRIKKARRKKNIAQADLADCLNISDSSLSAYENGVEDMKISYLPMISLYCDAPIEKLLPSEEMKEFINTVSMAVDITRKRYERREKSNSDNKRKLVSRTFEEGGMEYTIPAHKGNRHLNIKEQYRRGIVESDAEPLSEKEFYNYIKEKKPELIGIILDAGTLLSDLEDIPQTETIKGYVADFIVNKLFVVEYSKNNNHNNLQQERIYTYYKSLLERKMQN